MLRKMIVLLSLLLCTSLAVAADALEGTTWKIKLTATDGGKDFTDTLSFKGGQFSDETLAKKGFKPVSYDDNTTRFGPASFDVTLESDKDGKAKWNGSVSADQMTGTLAWTKSDGSVQNFTFSGERTSRN